MREGGAGNPVEDMLVHVVLNISLIMLLAVLGVVDEPGSPRAVTTPPAQSSAQAGFRNIPSSANSGSGSIESGGKPDSHMAPAVEAELRRLDNLHQSMISSQPIAYWRFETIRVGYQNLLRQSANNLELEEALRTRLNRLTQHEQAARAARTIESILTGSHRRDADVAAVRRQLSRVARGRARSYDAVGFIQPSARQVDGHRVFALIGRQGSTIAYLDIPPGLDAQPFLARRIGVRGQAHFSEELGTRLITVRDLESLETRK